MSEISVLDYLKEMKSDMRNDFSDLKDSISKIDDKTQNNENSLSEGNQRFKDIEKAIDSNSDQHKEFYTRFRKLDYIIGTLIFISIVVPIAVGIYFK